MEFERTDKKLRTSNNEVHNTIVDVLGENTRDWIGHRLRLYVEDTGSEDPRMKYGIRVEVDPNVKPPV